MPVSPVISIYPVCSGSTAHGFFYYLNSLNMSNQKNEAISLTVTEGITVSIIPNQDHEFLMSTREVASGYGVSPYSIRSTSSRNSSELIEGKHFVKGVAICNTQQPHQVYWTKRGIVRLGFFIKSERSKLFRDWAEDIIIKLEEQMCLFNEPIITKQLPTKRKHNRITQERLVDLLADVCRIEDSALRLSITNKLMGRS